MTPAEIKQGLKDLGITQQSLADELGVSKSMIGKVINGVKRSARIMEHIVLFLASKRPDRGSESVQDGKPVTVEEPSIASKSGPLQGSLVGKSVPVDEAATADKPSGAGRPAPAGRRKPGNPGQVPGKRGLFFTVEGVMPDLGDLSAVVVKIGTPFLIGKSGRGPP